MILKNIFNKNAKLHLDVLTNIEKIKGDSVVFYGAPTKSSWLGIANATKGLYPLNSVCIPQYYSNSLLSKKQTIKICEKVKELKFNTVIISGFPDYFFDWIEHLNHEVNVIIIFHGTISEFHNEKKKRFVNKLIKYGKEKRIKQFLFVKKGLEKIFIKLYGFNCKHQALNSPELSLHIEKLKLDETKIHIGVLGSDTFNKNLHNQVIHALMIENTIVHVLNKKTFDYLEMNDRIIGHGENLPKQKFLNILASMNVNLYISFNESWGLVAYESEALGVPCVNAIEVDYIKEIKTALSKAIH